MTEPLAFLNGNVAPQSQASLALNDAGFVFGATVTDLCRTFRHRLYRFSDHLERFRRSCRAAAIHPPITDEQISAAAQDLVVRNAKLIDGDADLALVLFATPGPIGFYLGQDVKAGDAPTFGMHTFPLPFARYRPWIEDGVHLMTPAVKQLPDACVDPHIKHRSRLHWWLAEQEARRSGAQALLLDLNGHVTETASANFLMVKDGTIVSPPRTAVLEGISLEVVMALCSRLNIPFVERNLTLDDCYAADEALLTCTTFCLAGVRRLNDRAIPWPGSMLRRLHDAWSADVGVNIHRQILEKKDA
jgi:branched-subunit amino acid aminotransferase/4-amino-4-deoxychorismate lyase